MFIIIDYFINLITLIITIQLIDYIFILINHFEFYIILIFGVFIYVDYHLFLFFQTLNQS